MKISIITASYNYENFIKETIESVLNQTYANWELIVVDDGSKDSSVEVIQNYCKQDSRINLYQHENAENRGLAETIKLGVQKANGDWIVFLESDDTIVSDYLEKKISVIKQYPNVDFVFNDINMFGDSFVIDEYEKYISKQREFLNNLSYPTKLHKKNGNIFFNLIPTFSCVMAKKKLFEGLDFNSPIKQDLDAYLWAQLMKKTVFYYLPEKLTNWRMHSNSYINLQKSNHIKDFLFRMKLTMFVYSFSCIYRVPLLFFKYLRRSFLWFGKRNGRYEVYILNNKMSKFFELFGKYLSNLFSIDDCSDSRFRIFRILGLKFKVAKKLHCFLEKEFILNSGFWDAQWYVQNYDKHFNSYEAFEYWYTTGWKKGESPSKYINATFCPKRINPILAYMSKQYCFYPDNKNNYKQIDDCDRVKDYLDYKVTRKSKSVIYTCITNDYDDLNEIAIYKYVDKDWDYVCFSDNEELIKQGQLGIWEIKPLQFNDLDSTRNNRWHKLHPHILFPEYEESVYIDANINILSSYLFDEIKIRNKEFILPKHFKNICIFREYKDVLKARLDKKEIINQQLDIIKQANMPKNWGFAENNVLYRKHNSAKIVNLMNDWWYFIKEYAKRDQLSLAYLLWKNDININDITFENTRYQIENFYVFGHKKGYK